jgi:hypothetical protein
LHVAPQPNIMDQYAQAQNIQQKSLELQQQQRQMADQQKVMAVLGKNNGNVRASLPELSGQVTPQTFMGLQKFDLDTRKAVADIDEKKVPVLKQQLDQLNGLVTGAAQLPDDQYAQQYPQIVARAKEIAPDNQTVKNLDPNQPIPKSALPQIQMLFKTQQNYLDERKVGAEETTAEARGGIDMAFYNAQIKEGKSPAEAFAATKQQAQTAKVPPLQQTQLDNLNKILADRFSVLNPGKPVPPQYTLQAGATQKDFDTIDKGLEQVEKAQAVKAQQQQAAATNAANKGNARSDKSYQFNSSQIEKIAAPIDQAISRLGRLQDTINQKTPQADALVAPELLTVMAGGQGSGLRMNEAEISRVIGGRTNFESLKAALNKWQLDPSKGLSITDPQREQIRALMAEVNNKLVAKQNALNEARQGLVESNDPDEHKRIVVNARTKMNQIDQGGGQKQTKDFGPAPSGMQEGHTGTAPDGTKVIVRGGRIVAQ